MKLGRVVRGGKGKEESDVLKKRKTFDTQEFMDVSKEDKLKVLKRCIKEANRILKKVKDDEEKRHEVERDVALLTTGESLLAGNKTLNNEGFQLLVETINKYYYKRIPLLILLLLLLCGLLIALRSCDSVGYQSRLPTGGEDLSELKDAANDEYVEIPGYQNLEVSKEQPYVQLRNLEGNSVYLQYNIVKGEETIYQSVLVEPGNKCDKWNAYESLGTGTHEVTLFIKTFDVETQAECNSTTQPVTITVGR